jgi:hypothetical protein
MGRSFYYALGGLGLLAMFGAVVASATEAKPGSLEHMRNEFRAHFDVTEGCGLVKFEGDADAAQVFWSETAGPLIDAMVSILSPATSNPDEITRITLTYLFPDCIWPAIKGLTDLEALQAAVLHVVKQKG